MQMVPLFLEGGGDGQLPALLFSALFLFLFASRSLSVKHTQLVQMARKPPRALSAHLSFPEPLLAISAPDGIKHLRGQCVRLCNS